MHNRTTKVNKDGKEYTLAIYNVEVDGPRPGAVTLQAPLSHFCARRVRFRSHGPLSSSIHGARTSVHALVHDNEQKTDWMREVHGYR